MLYKSTRNDNIYYDFKKIFFKGIADDGGLYIPDNIPIITKDEHLKYKYYNFKELCYVIFEKYTDNIPEKDLRKIIEKSFSSFKSKEITPIENLNEFYILELFHGPTNSFKDIALQFIGNLYEYFLEKDKKRLNIICATSGDTGSAAIYGLKGKSNINCIVLHPHNKISNIQKKQMVTINDQNVHNIAVNGTFDDCQKIVKEIVKKNNNITTVNSINWCRILIQITYYFYTYYKLCNDDLSRKINFSVPTGNFGDILAGYYAKKMGLPINKLIIATNENDILYRFYNTGVYEPLKCIETLTPAMDITISSNFERLLYYIIGNTDDLMNKLKNNGNFQIEEDKLNIIKDDFLCESIKDNEIKETIQYIYNKYTYLIDPHTAVGICSMTRYQKKNNETIDKNINVCLSTAHPGKFPEIILKCLPKLDDYFIPLHLVLLLKKKEYYKIMDKENVIDYIENILN